jgi:hypothetical protein
VPHRALDGLEEDAPADQPRAEASGGSSRARSMNSCFAAMVLLPLPGRSS